TRHPANAVPWLSRYLRPIADGRRNRNLSGGASLFVTVADLHPPDSPAGDHQHNQSKEQQPRYCKPGGSWLDDRSKRPFRDRYWNKGMKIVDDADSLERGRKEKIEPLPAVDNESGNHRVTEEESYHHEDCAIADAGEQRYPQIGYDLRCAGAVDQVLHIGRIPT